MPRAIGDLVYETSSTTGTGNFTLAAVNGKRRGSAVFGTGDNGADNPVMFISNRAAAEWEVVPCYWSDADTMVRGTPLLSSNSNNAVDFSAGTKEVTNDVPASLQVRLDAANVFTAVQAVYANNSATTPLLKVEQDDTGDAAYTALLTGGVQWTWGIDNSVSGDPWKLSASGTLGTTDILIATTGGNVGVNTSPSLPSNTPHTKILHVSGMVKSTGGGAGADGAFAASPYAWFSGANFSGNALFGFNLVAHATGGADKYRTPETLGANGYTAVDIIAGSIKLYGTTSGSTAGADVTPSVMAEIAPGGSVWGGATGGAKGAGTINAVAVYDDNTLLTCYVFDAALDGTLDLAKWDAKVANRTEAVYEDILEPYSWEVVEDFDEPVSTVVLKDGVPVVDPATGEPLTVETVRRSSRLVVKTAQRVRERRPVVDAAGKPVRRLIEERIHEPARKFAARLGGEYDPLDIDKYTRHWRDKRHLSSLPNEANFDPESGLPAGAWIQRLVETAELQAVHIAVLNERLKLVEQELAAARRARP